MTTQTGPAALRGLIDEILDNGVDADGLEAARKNLTDAWESDRRELSNVNADREKIWKALQEAQATIALYEGRHPAGLGPDGKEIAPRHRYTGDGICIRCGADAETDIGCVEELQAKLKHARETFEHLREHGQRTDDEELILDAGDEIALSIVLDAYGKPAPAGGEAR